MKSLLLTGGRIVDPARGLDEQADLLIVDGRVEAIGGEAGKLAGGRNPGAIPHLPVDGLVVAPGLIDSHVHLREPGQTAKETIATGTAAAARGGFTSVVCMPNTVPVIENAGMVTWIRDRAERQGKVRVFIVGAISKNLEGRELAPLGSLSQAGVVAVTDDGRCIQNHDLMRRALEYARMFDLPVLDHCQDESLVKEGVMHEGYWSTMLGLRGWPAVGEEAIVMRYILLAELSGAHVHCQHLGTAGSVRLLREAKARGVPISGEACPHHFTLTDAAIAGSEAFWREDGQGIDQWERLMEQSPPWPSYHTHFKMNPPLRSAVDRAAVWEGVADGTLEVIASDHAPHCDFEKEVEFDESPFGVIGLETELALALMQFYHAGRLSLSGVLEKFTVRPADILGLDQGTLAPGADGDVTLIDPDRTWVYRSREGESKASNTPFEGWELKGKAVGTIVAGEAVWLEETLRVSL